MFKKAYQQPLSIAALTCLSAGMVAIESVHAATIRYEFTSTMEEGLFIEGFPEIGIEPNPDLYDGKFTFDDSSLTGVGLETIGAEANLKVFLNDDPRVNQEVDFRFPEFPQVTFQDGEIVSLDWFAVYHPFTNVPEQNYPGDFINITGTTFTDGFDPTFYTPEDEPRSPVLGFGTVEYNRIGTVPEPGTILGIAIVALGLGFNRKKSILK